MGPVGWGPEETIPSETSAPAVKCAECRDGRWYSTVREGWGKPSCPPPVGDMGVAPVSTRISWSTPLNGSNVKTRKRCRRMGSGTYRMLEDGVFVSWAKYWSS